VLRKKVPFGRTPIWYSDYDPLSGIIKIGKERFFREQHGKDKTCLIEINPDFVAGNRLLFFIDINKRTTINGEEFSGTTISPSLRKELDSYLKNILNHHVESVFWSSLRSNRKDIALILISLLGGGFLGLIARGALARGGINI
jgi:hypothetical protein